MKKKLFISSLIVVSAILIVVGVVYTVCDIYMTKISEASIQNWLQSEKVEIQEGNLLNAITKNQRVLLSSEFIRGVVLIDLSVEKQSSLIAFGKPISSAHVKTMIENRKTTLNDGLFQQIAISHIPGNEKLALAFYIESSFLRSLFFITSAGLIFIFAVFLILIFVMQKRESLKRESFLKSTLENFLDGQRETEQLQKEFPRLFDWWSRKKSDFDQVQNQLIESKGKIIFAEMSARIAHDIRSPMGVLSRLAEEQSKESKTGAILQQVTNRLQKITDDLIQHWQESKHSTSLIDIGVDNRKQFPQENIVPLIQSLVLEKKNLNSHLDQIQWILDFNVEKLGFSIDHNEFARHFSNLLDNAVDASGISGQIAIKLRDDDKVIKIEIKDTGCGIPKEILSNIGTKNFSFGKSNGNGLGIFYAKKFVRQIGGQLVIESEIGQGSSFSIIIPKNNRTIVLKNSSQIAYVDDDHLGHGLWKKFSKSMPENLPNTLHFSNSSEYLYWLKTGQNHILFTDYDLKEDKVNGLDLIESTRQMNLYSDSVLITNSYDSPIIMQRAASLDVQIIPKNQIFEYSLVLV
jgi:signal transduction histidine kinase